MKKIIAIIVIVLAFSVNANAQQKTATPQKVEKKAVEKKSPKDIKEASMNDLMALKKAVVAFEGTQEADLLRLFEYKHDLLKQDLSADRKQILTQSIEDKLKATLTPDQMQKVSAKPALLKQLCN